jgi:DHA2 family multidrug resistance protein-like MFS transporter
MASTIGWQWIFIVSIALSILAFFLIKHTPETKVSAACVTITLTLNSVITNSIKPVTSNFVLVSSTLGSTLVSGVVLGAVVVFVHYLVVSWPQRLDGSGFLLFQLHFQF